MAQTLEDLQAKLTPRPSLKLGDGVNSTTIRDANAIWQRENADVLAQIKSLQSSATTGYQPDGTYELNLDVTDEQAEEMAGRVAREQFERYMQRFAPQEKAILATQDDTRAQDAASTAQADAVRSRAALERMRSRYGVTNNASQQQAEASNFQRSTALGSLSAVNFGRQLDEDRRFNLQGAMLNIGNNLQQSAQNGLTVSATNAAAREQAYQSARAQHKANQWGILGSI
ncbi:hypothetical protein [Halomonas sp. 707B3]|uniref:hypothetical protein n=1 Tax=Halomonas sp. 707B3 TaxID=1681043 RepID=UPI0020A00171|nr:hypothetical protein [Halomonas sp. 707B3]MCP1316851.1 hypothetical protein [Halomonas sp. 707B3]